MKVNSNQNPAIPVQESNAANIQDGTSNTIMFGERTKPEKPFAKDTFESFRFEMGGLPCDHLAETTKPSPKSELDGSSKEAPLRGEEKVIDSISQKYTFMDYTDDDCM